MKQKLIIGLIIVLLAIGIVVVLRSQNGGEPTVQNFKSTPKDQEPTPKPAPSESSFDKTTYSYDDPSSIWVFVNKQRPLQPKSYAPDDLVFPAVRLRVPDNESMQLRSETAKAFEALVAGAADDGIELMLSSGYRSYNYQVTLYGNYVKTQGQDVADTESARPGHSEHQTGLAVDVRPINGECELEQCFGEMPEGKWIADHAHEYGFILRYPKGKKDIVGYNYEPWHIRYIGVDAAKEYVRTNAGTLEEFFGFPAAPDY